MPESTDPIGVQTSSAAGAIPARIMQSMLRLTTLLNSTREVDELLDVLVQESLQLIQAECGVAAMRTPDGIVCSRYVQRGTPVSREYHWPSGRELPRWLLIHKTPYVTNDAPDDPQIVHGLCEGFGVTNALLTPILDAQGEVTGFLQLHNKASGFTEADRDLLMAVSHAGAMALGNALTRRELQQQKAERRQIEEEVAIRVKQALLESEERYRDLFENANDIVYTLDLHGNLTEINRKGEEILGFPREEALGKPIGSLVAPEDLARMRKMLARKVEGDQQTTHELRIHARNGQERTLEVSSRLLYRDGRPVGVHGIARDITRRKEVTAALQASRDQLQAILESVADGVIVQDVAGNMVYANETAARMCGFPSAAALLAAPLPVLLGRFSIRDAGGAPLPRERLPAQRAFRGEPAPAALLRWRFRKGHGSDEDRWTISQARAVLDGTGRVAFVVSAFQDVTALKQEETRARFLGEASALLAESLDYEATLQRVAQLAVPDLADWASVEMVEADGSIRMVALAHTDPAKVTLVRDLARQYPVDPDAPAGTPHVIRTGRSQLYTEMPAKLGETAMAHDLWRRSFEALHPTAALIVPLRARGRTLGAISFVQAESGRRCSEADLQLAENLANRAALAVDNARLYRDAQDALRVREEFLSTISHDLRTPLTTIRGHAQLLVRQAGRLEAPASPRLAASLAEIERSTRVMERMIGDLLDLSRIEAGRTLELDRQRVDLVRLVQELAKEQQHLTTKHRIVVKTPSKPIVGLWDASRLERAIANLLSNAVKHSLDGGEITVSVRTLNDAGRRGRWAELRVRDRGIGIPPADLAQVFERFHRARNVGGRIQGLGIGLAGAKQIVEQHGGTISAESEEGKGSIFSIRLPLEQLAG